MSALTRRLEQAAATVRGLEKEQYLRQLTGGQLETHVGLARMGVLEAVAPDVILRRRGEEPRERQVHEERVSTEIGAALAAEYGALTDAEVLAIVWYWPWLYLFQPGVWELFGVPGGREVLLQGTREATGLQGLTLETVWPELEARQNAALEGICRRAGTRLGVPADEVRAWLEAED